MFSENLLQLRRQNSLSQEEPAENLKISRQTLSKGETGESVPDIENCRIPASFFGVTLDELVNYEPDGSVLGVPPLGKHAFGIVTVGDKGQIVIPAMARKIFSIKPRDRLLILGGENKGIEIIRESEIFEALINPFQNK